MNILEPSTWPLPLYLLVISCAFAVGGTGVFLAAFALGVLSVLSAKTKEESKHG